MDQRLTLLTLGVSDYGRSKAFYLSLGWSAALEIEETAFFQCNGVILALWSREKLAPDLGIPENGARWSGIALAHNVHSREEVHAVIEQACYARTPSSSSEVRNSSASRYTRYAPAPISSASP